MIHDLQGFFPIIDETPLSLTLTNDNKNVDSTPYPAKKTMKV